MQLASSSQRTPFAGLPKAERDQIAVWAEPVIADRLREIYTQAAGVRHLNQLIVHHRHLWRSVLREDLSGIAASRHLLLNLSQTDGLPFSFLDEVDNAIIEELMEIVLSRYRTSRILVKHYSLWLVAVAAELGAARAAA